ncbi:MAG: LUD domain-containing protein [Desulfobacteraceae bacterium]|nr:LUD domain-containing protein [Desulfobacteraceae bacterium]
MAEHNEQQFLSRVRRALGRSNRSGKPLTTPDLGFTDQIRSAIKRTRNRQDADFSALADILKTAAPEINLGVEFTDTADRMRSAMMARIEQADPEWGDKKTVTAWRHPLLERLELDAALSRLNVPLYYPPVAVSAADDFSNAECDEFKTRAAKATVGITAADFCLADTGTLVLRNRPDHPRIVSLLPSIHMAAMTMNQLLLDFTELYAILSDEFRQGMDTVTNAMTFVSGPSKTADIEATLVHGAHGPRQVCLFILRGE